MPANLRFASFALGTLLCLAAAGCGSGIRGPFPPPGFSGPPVTPVDPGGSISGNWIFNFTPASGTPALQTAFGSIDESSSGTTQGAFTTSVLVVNAPCYAAAPQVPAQGFATPTALTLNSFGDNNQFLGLAATITNGGSTLTGTYTVSSGCAQGAKGTFTASRFAVLTGTYVGPVTGPATGRNLSLALKQSTLPAGDGTFLLSGTATFTGFSCFTSGTATPTGGFVSGPNMGITFTTNESTASTLIVIGNFDLPAKTISALTYKVQGGACNGQTGTGTLALGS